jgi:C1A family cysteine protease
MDQENLGACVVNAFAGITQCLIGNTPSRLYLYFNARVATGNSPSDDTGLDLSQSLPIIKSYGLPPETVWNYSKISYFSRFPPLSVYKSNSITTKTLIYTAISQTDTAIMNAIFAKTLIMFGFDVYQSFMTNTVAQTGIVPTPNTKTEQCEGGHCVSIVGWTSYNKIQYYIIRNSWGTYWGNTGAITYQPNNGANGGFAYIPKSYVLNPSLAYEFYSIKYH